MLLLDTNVLIWLTRGDQRLGTRARRAVDEALASDDVAVSSISFWELAMLVEKGRVAVAWPVEALRGRLLQQGLREIPVDGEIAMRSVTLSDLPADPADRIIVATAVAGHCLVTADQALLAWPGQMQRLQQPVAELALHSSGHASRPASLLFG